MIIWPLINIEIMMTEVLMIITIKIMIIKITTILIIILIMIIKITLMIITIIIMIIKITTMIITIIMIMKLGIRLDKRQVVPRRWDGNEKQRWTRSSLYQTWTRLFLCFQMYKSLSACILYKHAHHTKLFWFENVTDSFCVYIIQTRSHTKLEQDSFCVEICVYTCVC